MAEKLKAWQCIGCGRLESQETRLWICQDRKVEFVYAAEYERLATIVRQIVLTTPTESGWERTYRVLQRRAGEALGAPR